MKLTFTAALLFFSAFLFGQYDTLVFANGTKKAVIVKELTKLEVRYKLPADSTGPTFVVNVKQVKEFIFKNGYFKETEITERSKAHSKVSEAIPDDGFKRSIFSTDILQIAIIKHVQFNLERIGKRRKNAIELYINFGLKDRESADAYKGKEVKNNPVADGEGYYKYGYGGINIKLYPYTQKKFNYFIAFGIEVGKVSCMLTKFNYATTGTTSYSTSSTIRVYESNYWNYHLNNGCVFRLNNRLIIQSHIGIGLNQFQRVTKPTEESGHDFSFKYGLGFLLGVAF